MSQERIKNCKVVLAGIGLGSVIAECALRLGFENICLIDGDVVEITNLNRQNYTLNDIGKPKVIALMERLKSINPNANIECQNLFLNEHNIKTIIHRFDIAVNAIDFNSMTPFLFDEVCINLGIPVLHPYNLGWTGCAFVVTDNSERLTYLQNHHIGFEVKFAKHVMSYLKKQQLNIEWLEHVIDQFMNEPETLPPPQLSVASWITAGLCVNIMYNLAIGEEIKALPEFYYLSAII